MPSKKKKYNARFPAGRIKKIMQSDEEVGKVAQAVPVIISRTLELFVGSLLQKAMQITSAKNAKTLTPSHMKQCILSEQRFDFLKDLVESVQDSSNGDDDLSATTPCPLVGLPSRSIPQRRTSSCSSVKEERDIIKELTIKDEPLEEQAQVAANSSRLHLNPNFYLEPPSDRRVSETITSRAATSSAIPLSAKMYPESVVPDLRSIGPSIKTEQGIPVKEQTAIRCSAIRLNPNFYPDSDKKKSNNEIKTESVTGPQSSSSSERFCPNFYAETMSDLGTVESVGEPHLTAKPDSSSLHLGPTFYSDTLPVKSPPPAHRQKHTKLPPFTMDENYDT